MGDLTNLGNLAGGIAQGYQAQQRTMQQKQYYKLLQKKAKSDIDFAQAEEERRAAGQSWIEDLINSGGTPQGQGQAPQQDQMLPQQPHMLPQQEQLLPQRPHMMQPGGSQQPGGPQQQPGGPQRGISHEMIARIRLAQAGLDPSKIMPRQTEPKNVQTTQGVGPQGNPQLMERTPGPGGTWSPAMTVEGVPVRSPAARKTSTDYMKVWIDDYLRTTPGANEAQAVEAYYDMKERDPSFRVEHQQELELLETFGPPRNPWTGMMLEIDPAEKARMAKEKWASFNSLVAEFRKRGLDVDFMTLKLQTLWGPPQAAWFVEEGG